MNLVASVPVWLLVVLAALIAAAAVEDAVRLRISNLTCGGVLVAALIAMGFAGFHPGLWQNGLVFLVLLLGGMMVFNAGKMGGGDVKLLAVIGLWMDIRAGVWLLASVLLAGGVLALLYLLGRMAFRKRRRRLGQDDRRGAGIPYGLAIVAGAAFVFATQLGMFVREPVKPNPFAIPGLPPLPKQGR